MPFHKSCYTSRSSGYKYRTLSTSTGPDKKKSRKSGSQQEVSSIDQKFQILQDSVSLLISKELDDTDRSRAAILEKMEKIEAKINSLVELQENIISMRQTLNSAENTLGDLYHKVQKIEVRNEINSIKLRKNNPKAKQALTDDEVEKEIFSTDVIVPPSVLAL